MASINTDSAAGLQDASFDFVIVGGGTSGLVVANRLSEDLDVRVLVLEAGTNRVNDPRIQIPGLAATTYENPEFDWDFRSTPQEQLNGRTLLGTKGRTLGGSSAINLGMVVHPSRTGLSAWEALGNPGWGWDNFEPYVRKFHTGTPPPEAVRAFFAGMVSEKEDQGSDGPVQVSFGDQYMPYHSAWLRAFEALGWPQTEDPIKGGPAVGPFVTPGAVDPATHTRSHAAAAYLGPAVLQRESLRVVTGARVERIVFNTSSDPLTATGVTLTKGSQTYTITVTKEVILAAGAAQTTGLLELSGIGNAALLQSHGITPLVDLPSVGENLQDHGSIAFGYEVADGMPSGDMARNPAVAAAAMAAYQKDGSGPLGMVPMVSAFMPCLDFPAAQRENLLRKIDASLEDQNLPTMYQKQYTVLRDMLLDPNEPTAMYVLAPFQILPRAGPNPRDIFSMSNPGNFISITSLLSHPFSRGSVHLASADPTAAPVIDAGILRHPADLELHARHNIWMEKIAEAEPMVSLLKPGGDRLHTPQKLDVTDLERAQELCKELVLSMYHVCGTCAMMPREDGGVVDPRLKVYGTRNVRVVDASVFPLVPRGRRILLRRIWCGELVDGY
ncbi:GMC oxidoreductase-domain-containing protein [Aspergillus keveii]|uniref:GMC oxidoreductase-domain-containing protein n=1 Tax=Aspergillus keveii TaxID=714993 RepID=A0ABR4G6M8_9EURO